MALIRLESLFGIHHGVPSLGEPGYIRQWQAGYVNHCISIAACHSVLQRVADDDISVAACYSMLQCVVDEHTSVTLCCSELQHVAVCYR